MSTMTTDKTLISVNPATGETLAEIYSDAFQETALKADRARKAFGGWRAASLKQRLAAIHRLHNRLAGNVKRVAQTLSAETGRPLQESLGADVLPTLRSLEFLCRQAPSILKPIRLPVRRTRACAEPYGVVGIIGTWNYPLLLNLVPICQALAAGNTVVWKPSELAISSALETQRLLEAVEFPPGVIEVSYGDAETGRALTQAQCDKYVFTGSVAVGRAILEELARSGKPAVMELSGNDSFIVCSDAFLELTARSAVWGRVCNAGQSCVAPQRFYVERSVYEPFLKRVKAHLEDLQPHELTPLRTRAAREHCHRLVREAVEQGARLLHGGEYEPSQPGFFYTPTLLADCNDTQAVMRQDLFGPVIAVCPVLNEREAIDRANSNPLALGASVWTRNLQKGAALAAQLRVGLVSVNDVLLDAAHPAIPFGGMRSSGFGKQRGAQGLEAFVIRKVTALHAPSGARRHLFPYLPPAANILLALARMRLPGGWPVAWELARAAFAWQKQSQERTREYKP